MLICLNEFNLTCNAEIKALLLKLATCRQKQNSQFIKLAFGHCDNVLA